MINYALIYYYATLIEKKVKTIEEVPDNIRELVQKYLNGENIYDTTSADYTKDEEKKENKLLGAINIAPIYKLIPKEFNIDGNVYITIPIFEDEIFSKEIRKDLPLPSNPKYSIKLYELYYNIDESLLDIKIIDNMIHIEGKNRDKFSSGERFMRCDVMMISDNYEPTRLVFYIDIE